MIRFASPGPIAASFGPVTVRWYGLLLACAAVLALALARHDAAKRGEDAEAFLATWRLALAGGIVGSRLYHVAFHWEYFRQFPLRMLAVWEGGVGILGGILGGVIVVFVYTWWNRLPLGRYLDIIAPGLVLGQAIGRWGNFFNEEAFGRPTSLPWALYISPGHRPPGFTRFESFHPTFLYESLWDVAVFLVTFFVLRRRCARVPGSLFLAYLALYSVGRIAIEGLRLDSEMVGPYRSAQIVAGVCLVAASALQMWLWRPRAVGGARDADRLAREGGEP